MVSTVVYRVSDDTPLDSEGEPGALTTLTADDLRRMGWSVACHHDYCVRGRDYRFWLFTKDNRCAKGSGPSDAYALAEAYRAVLAMEEHKVADPDPDANELQAAWMDAASAMLEAMRAVPAEARVGAASWVMGEMRRELYLCAGILCPGCQGDGYRNYPNTATWRSGPGVISGRAITTDVCDSCWGSGRSDEPGIDLRQLVGRAGKVGGDA